MLYNILQTSNFMTARIDNKNYDETTKLRSREMG